MPIRKDRGHRDRADRDSRNKGETGGGSHSVTLFFNDGIRAIDTLNDELAEFLRLITKTEISRVPAVGPFGTLRTGGLHERI